MPRPRGQPEGRIRWSERVDRPTIAWLSGLERVSVWHYGQPATQPPPLAIHVHEGEDSVTLAGTKETLTGPGSLIADSTGRFLPKTKKELPPG